MSLCSILYCDALNAVSLKVSLKYFTTQYVMKNVMLFSIWSTVNARRRPFYSPFHHTRSIESWKQKNGNAASYLLIDIKIYIFATVSDYQFREKIIKIVFREREAL